MAVHYGPRERGLFLYLDAGISASYSGTGTSWADLSGNRNNGTLINDVSYDSNNKGSLVFNGTNGYVSCSGSLVTNEATFITWLKRNGSQVSYAGILFSRGGGGSTTGLDFVSTTNRIGYHWNDASNTWQWGSGPIVPDLTWCMCAISVRSSSATAYLCQASGTTSATNFTTHATTTLSSIRVGTDTTTGDRLFKGNIAIAKLYNRALSAEDIQKNFNSARGRFGI